MPAKGGLAWPPYMYVLPGTPCVWARPLYFSRGEAARCQQGGYKESDMRLIAIYVQF